MPSPSSIFNFKRQNPLAGLLFFALAVVLIESTLALLPQNSLITSFRAQNLPTTAPDWQIMGDSVAAGGIKPELMAPHLAPQTNVVNLALSGSGPEFTYFILQREIAAGVAPKAILYAPSPHTFGSQRTALLVGAYATWSEVAEIAAARIEPFEALYGIVCRFSYSLRHREQLAEVLKGRRMPEGIEPAQPQTAKTENGSNPETSNDSGEDRFPASRINQMYRKQFDTSEFNLFFARKFLALAQAKQIPVYWTTMPVLKVVQESRKPLNYEADYLAFVDGLQKQYHLNLVTNPVPVMAPRYFKDYLHLNEEGATQFTGLLGNEIKLRKPGS